MPRGSFHDEIRQPTQFTAWVLLPGMDEPVGFDTVEEALEVIQLETLWTFVPESRGGHG